MITFMGRHTFKNALVATMVLSLMAIISTPASGQFVPVTNTIGTAVLGPGATRGGSPGLDSATLGRGGGTRSRCARDASASAGSSAAVL